MQATGANPSTNVVSTQIPEIPTPAPRTPVPPPFHGVLPASREDYEKFDEYNKNPRLDFLILGKIPDRDRQVTHGSGSSEWTETISLEQDFSEIVSDCLQRGELDALEFLWRESGRNPETSTVTVKIPKKSTAMMKTLVEHCHSHPGLKVKLITFYFHPSTMTDLTTLIAQGTIGSLEIGVAGIESEDLNRLSDSFGKLEELKLTAALFDIHSEKVFAESILNSSSLKKLDLISCDFGPSRGMQFVEGMQTNQSIVDLEMFLTPIPTTDTSGYGAILEKNKVLQSVMLTGAEKDPLDFESIIFGATMHPSLQSLQLRTFPCGDVFIDPLNLNQLLQNNRVLTKLRLGAKFLDLKDYQGLTAALESNLSLTEFSLGAFDDIPFRSFRSMQDSLARNRALANGSTMAKAGQAFDPDPLLRNGLSDAGSVIARYVLANSSSLEEFAHTMAGVELSMREAINQTLANSSSSATTTTTTTTGTTTTPPDAASS